jgi:TRAP-type C4-dicarboxylate transport system substrate-binding protein
VQKSISLTSHVWDAYWILGNRRAFQALPADMRAIVTREFEAAGMNQRADIAKLNGSLRDDLKAKGINMVDVDREAFRSALKKTSFYTDWKSKYGDQGWGTLEKYTGKLV